MSVFPGRFTCLYQQRFGTKMFNLRVGKFFNVVSYLCCIGTVHIGLPKIGCAEI